MSTAILLDVRKICLHNTLRNSLGCCVNISFEYLVRFQVRYLSCSLINVFY